MSPHFTPSKALLAVALAVSATAAAHAQTASASASLSNFRIELIDLDPADGIAPNLTLTPADQVSQTANVYYSTTDPNLGQSKYNSGKGTASSSLSSIDASASANAGAGTWQAAGSYAQPVGNSIYLVSDSYGYYSFKLTRATRMIVTADASVTGFGDGSRNKSEAWASINGQFDDGLENQVIDGLSWAGTAADEQIGISMQTLYGSLYGWLQFGAHTKVQYDAARPVPEPAMPAMLLAGVAVLGLCARRKGKRAA